MTVYSGFGHGPSALWGLLWAEAFTYELLNGRYFSSAVQRQVTTGLSSKTLSVGAQILGQREMKEIYFQLNVLFISVCKTSGEPLPPQGRPTSPTCGMCGYLCDAAARLSVRSLLLHGFP